MSITRGCCLAVVVLLAVAVVESADIKAIFDQMDYEDKCGQMTQVTFSVNLSLYYLLIDL